VRAAQLAGRGPAPGAGAIIHRSACRRRRRLLFPVVTSASRGLIEDVNEGLKPSSVRDWRHVQLQLAAGATAGAGSAGAHWWQTPLLAGAFALLGVLIAQLVVFGIARRNERNRSEPQLLIQCAAFSVATGRLKREFARRPNTPNLAAVEDLEAAADALDINGTDALQDAAREVIGVMPLLIEPGKFTEEHFDDSLKRLFYAHMAFKAACRKHFDKPEAVHKATPMLGPVDISEA